MPKIRRPRRSIDAPPWYPIFPADHLVALARFTLEERGALDLLRDHFWLHGSLPADPDRLAQLLGRTRDQFDALWPMLAPCFTERGDEYVHTTLAKKRAGVLARRAQCAESGRKGMAVRWGDRRKKNGRDDARAPRARKHTGHEERVNPSLVYQSVKKDWLTWNDKTGTFPTRDELLRTATKNLFVRRIPYDTASLDAAIETVTRKWQHAKTQAEMKVTPREKTH
jgi:uncharacterized protein YdaU (DUF1376 family)